jgi:hypothetical protein
MIRSERDVQDATSNPDAPEDRFIGFVKWICRKPAGGEDQPIWHVPGGRMSCRLWAGVFLDVLRTFA